MKLLLTLLALLAVPAFATEYVNGNVLLLDAGKQITVQDAANPGVNDWVSSQYMAPTHRLKVRLSVINTPLQVGSQTACTDPCIIQMRRTFGQQYLWSEEVDSAGASLTPKKLSAATIIPQVDAASCDAVGAWSLPLEIVGQDNYQHCVSVTVPAGSPTTSIALEMRINNTLYRNPPFDSKVSFKVNGGAWITANNANTTSLEQQQWLTRKNNGTPNYGYPAYIPPAVMGSILPVIRVSVPIPNGLLVAGATNTITFRTAPTDGVSSGYRVIEFNLLATATAKTMSQIAVTSNVATATTGSAHGFANGSFVFLYNAPGMQARFNGLRTVTAVGTTTTFSFAPCGVGVGYIIAGACTSPDGTYVTPTTVANAEEISNNPQLAQPTMTAVQALLSPSTFTYTAPSSFTAPAGGNAANGQTFFSNIALQVSGDPKHNYAMTAVCSDCHDSKGRDLSYFGYSNWAIAQRSTFHGLTWQQALDVAAYIRSLDATSRTAANGRPWNPPYQPGPGLDSLAVNDWSAGAGIDAQLTYDADLREYMAPNSFAKIQPAAQLNPHETPLMWQLFEWNQWLPEIHPTDIAPHSVFNFLTEDPYLKYQTYASAVAASNAFSTYQNNDWFTGIITTGTESQRFQQSLDPNVASRQNNSAANTLPSSFMQHYHAAATWMAPKLWELFHGGGYEGSCSAMYTALYGASTNGYLSRCLMPWGRNLFYLGLHVSNSEGDGASTPVAPINPVATFDYSSNVWYNLALIVGSAGNRRAHDGDMLDWQYFAAFVENEGDYIPAGWHTLLEPIYAAQGSADEDISVYQNSPDGGNPSSVYYAFGWSAFLNRAISFKWHTSAQMADITNQWATFLYNLTQRYTVAQWRGFNDLLYSTYGIACPANATGVVVSGNNGPNQPCQDLAYTLAVAHYWGANQTTLNNIVAWANTVWNGSSSGNPVHNFTADAAATCVVQNGAGGSGGVYWLHCTN